jgi:hypothetical protein
MNGRGEIYTRFCSEKLMGRDLSEDLGVDRRIILEWNFEK